MFREEVAKGTELGKLAKVYMDRGDYVPDEVTIDMLLKRLENTPKNGVLLDGFPRTVEQARALDEALAKKGTAIDKVANINVSEEELTRRLGGRLICERCHTVYNEATHRSKRAGICDRCGGMLYQREDDSPEAARRRLKVYFQQTTPVLEFYRKQGKLVEVSGEGPIEDVTFALLNAVGAATALPD
jgi:adenylate kinase